MIKVSANKLSILGIAAVLVASAGGTLAYLTDAEEATNTFTMGDVSIETLEKNYPGNDTEKTKDQTPNQETPKDPLIDNKGTNDAIVFITVDSPMEEITVINDDGTLQTAKSVNELFWFKNAADAVSKHVNNFDKGWQELKTKEMYVKIAENGSETKVEPAALATTYKGLGATDRLVKRYVFGYKQPIQGSTKADGTAQTPENKKTTPLFGKVQLKNVIEGEIDESTQSIVVRSFAIQAANVLENSADLAEGKPYTEANLNKIFDIFVAQNSTKNDKSGLKIEGLRDADSVKPTENGASGTKDQHVNRWDTDKDVSSPNNKKPS